MRHAINEKFKILPDEICHTEQPKRSYAFGCVTEMDMVQLIYRPFELQGSTKDYEFSRGTMNTRWSLGLANALTTLLATPWLAPKTQETGVRVFDVLHGLLVAYHQAQTSSQAEPSPYLKTPAPAQTPEMRTER